MQGTGSASKDREAPRIFLLDDEEILSWCIEMELEALGFQVRTAKSVEEGREVLRHYHPDLLICDQGLPDGWGTELIKTYRDLEGNVPVILITAFTPPEKAVLQSIGADECLRKPFDLRVLTDKVRDTLSGLHPPKTLSLM